MQSLNLTQSYLTDYIQNSDREAYENSFPQLFKHYYEYWTRKELELVKIDKLEIEKRIDWIENLLSKLIPKLDMYNLDTSKIEIVYMIGVGTTNGHAFKHDGTFYVWLPLETYNTAELVNVFVTHEIAHAIHYNSSPSFYFDTIDERYHISRQLITEGLATYLTREFLGCSDLEALWADYLPKQQAESWWSRCQDNEQEIFKLIANKYNDGLLL
jgi:uncharacterized protein YjaZ